MVVALIAACALGVFQEKPSAAALISKSILHYKDAHTISGTIRWVQSALNAKVVVNTRLDIARPNKIALLQTKEGKEPRTYALTSDGIAFTYDRPETRLLQPERVQEDAIRAGTPLTVQDMYVAESQSLPDRSPVLDIALSHPAYLKEFKGRLASLSYEGKAKVRDVDVNVLKGELRTEPGVPPTGNFEMYVTDGGDILKYVELLRFAEPTTKSTVEVASVWDVDLKVDTSLDSSVFKLIR